MQFSNISIFKQQIRRYIRQRRRMLTAEQQIRFAYQAAMHLVNWIPISTLHNIALFLPFDGELNTYPLIKYFWTIGKAVYLPSLYLFNLKELIFLRYYPHTRLVLNQLKIYEPEFHTQNLLPIDKLDLLIVPLIAFDIKGNRLGMGGGFYDRTLQNWQKYSNFHLVGYAHNFQLVDNLYTEEWDVPLPIVITPSKLWIW